MYEIVKVSVTTSEGILLDTFFLSHWKSPSAEDENIEEQENIGSAASYSNLVHRLERFVKKY